MNDLPFQNKLYITFATLPPNHFVRQHFLDQFESVLIWWEKVKHNTGPEWDEFRLKLIEEVHLR